ncbi:MAG: peptidylprolyl isomerase [Pseudomonadota bacterium]|nr:peptidylprolyl isomerase [Pseudomonadota bacterium]
MKYMLIGWLLVLTPTGYGEEILEHQEVPRVSIQTNLGVIEIELNPEKAPETVENFLQYAREGFYEGTIFHRVIPDFVIQAGGYTTDYNKKPIYSSVPNEAKNGLKNVRGSVAMARSADPHSASSQFFINLKDNSFLNYTASTLSGWGYAVFGKVVDGMNVVDQIAKLPTEMIDGTLKYVPQTPVVIEAVTIDNVPATYWSDTEAEPDEADKELEDQEVAAEEDEATKEELPEETAEPEAELEEETEDTVPQQEEPEAELKAPVEEAPEDTVSQQEEPEAELKASVEEEAEDTVPEDEATDSIEAQPAEEEKQAVEEETTAKQQQDSASEQESVEAPTEASSATTMTESSEAALSTEPEVSTTEQAAAETETPEISKKTLLSIPDSPKFTVTQPPDSPSEPDTPEANPF